MKNKNKKMEVLRQDLIKYSKQIGIVDCEIPKLVFYGEEFKAEQNETFLKYGGYSSQRTWRYTTHYGFCSSITRLIFVNMRGTRTLRELRNTLIHELLHYRFKGISHKEIDKRIRKILAGKQYPRKQITCPQFGSKWC
jgi:hypothetical protein